MSASIRRGRTTSEDGASSPRIPALPDRDTLADAQHPPVGTRRGRTLHLLVLCDVTNDVTMTSTMTSTITSVGTTVTITTITTERD